MIPDKSVTDKAKFQHVNTKYIISYQLDYILSLI